MEIILVGVMRTDAFTEKQNEESKRLMQPPLVYAKKMKVNRKMDSENSKWQITSWQRASEKVQIDNHLSGILRSDIYGECSIKLASLSACNQVTRINMHPGKFVKFSMINSVRIWTHFNLNLSCTICTCHPAESDDRSKKYHPFHLWVILKYRKYHHYQGSIELRYRLLSGRTSIPN